MQIGAHTVGIIIMTKKSELDKHDVKVTCVCI
mgnify:CR=1 FL=1